ncbi:MAG: polyphenol oxidase family protein [Bdellovibrionales bacterium]
MLEEIVDKDGVCLGKGAFFDDYIIFFGNSSGTLERLASHFSKFTFRFIKQVHGDRVIASCEGAEEADGHYTSEINIALCIRTADCIPVLFKAGTSVFALHCGWRGVANGISLKALELCMEAPKQVFIGPHIPYTHFEVHNDVAARLLRNYNGMIEAQYQHSDPEKSFIDLDAILLDQFKMDEDDFIISAENTLTDTRYNSHRRDQTKDRNISFICRLN